MDGLNEMEPTPASKLTYSDFQNFPDDGLRHELIDGVHYVTPSPNLRHQRVSKNLFLQLRDHFENRQIGEVFYAPFDVVLGNHDVLVPDLLVARSSQLSARAVEGAPLLVVEILSPSSVSRDRRLKFRRYAALGVVHYWIVDPDARAIDCYRLQGGRFKHVAGAAPGAPVTLEHPDFPALAIPTADLWAEPA